MCFWLLFKLTISHEQKQYTGRIFKDCLSFRIAGRRLQRRPKLAAFVVSCCCYGRTFVADEGQQALGLRNITDCTGTFLTFLLKHSIEYDYKRKNSINLHR